MANTDIIDLVDPFLDEASEYKTHQLSIRSRFVAVYWAGGLNFKEIAKEMKISTATVSKIWHTPECQSLIAKINASDLIAMRTALRPILPEAAKRIQEDIEDPNSPDKYKAMKFLWRIFDFDKVDKQSDQAMGTYHDALKALFGNNAPKIGPKLEAITSDAGKEDDSEVDTEEE